MKNLTPEEIDRFVEAIKAERTKAHLIDLITTYQIRTALATVTLDQPRLDLKEVEQLISIFHPDTHAVIRARIGYTLDDLK